MAKPRATRPEAEDAETSMSYEQALAELESLIDRIERGEIGLEESLAEYRRGAALLKRCRGILETAEQQIEQLTADGSED